MGAIASQITSLAIVYSTVYPDADQRKHQSSASLAFVRGIHRGPGNSPHKWPVTRKMFPFDDVIMGRCVMEGCWWQHDDTTVSSYNTVLNNKTLNNNDNYKGFDLIQDAPWLLLLVNYGAPCCACHYAIIKPWDVINHTCSNFSGSWVKPLLNICFGWVMSSAETLDIYLYIINNPSPWKSLLKYNHPEICMKSKYHEILSVTKLDFTSFPNSHLLTWTCHLDRPATKLARYYLFNILFGTTAYKTLMLRITLWEEFPGNWWIPLTKQSETIMTSSNGNIFRVTGALCEGNSPVTQRPLTRSFGVFFLSAPG